MPALGKDGKPKRERTAGQSTSSTRDVAQEASSAIKGRKQSRRAADSILESSDGEDSASTSDPGGLSQSPRERRKKQTVDNVMTVVMQWLDSKFPPIQTCQGGSPSSRSRGASGRGGGRGESKKGGGGGSNNADKENEAPRRPKKRQQRDESPGGDDDDDEDKKGKGNKRARKDPEEVQRKFACPFYKHDPSKHKSSRACRFPGFDTLHRLKEHIYRQHLDKNGCPRCATRFSSAKALDAHLRADEMCQKKDILSHDGIDEAQEKLIRARPKKDSSTREEKWVIIYKIIFPDTPKDSIPSPYCDELLSEELDGMREYVRRGIPRFVRRKLEEEIEQAHNNTEKEMIIKFLDLLPSITDQLIEGYRGQKNQPNDDALAPLSSGIAELQPPAGGDGTVFESPQSWIVDDFVALEDIDYPTMRFFPTHGEEASFGPEYASY